MKLISTTRCAKVKCVKDVHKGVNDVVCEFQWPQWSFCRFFRYFSCECLNEASADVIFVNNVDSFVRIFRKYRKYRTAFNVDDDEPQRLYSDANADADVNVDVDDVNDANDVKDVKDVNAVNAVDDVNNADDVNDEIRFEDVDDSKVDLLLMLNVCSSHTELMCCGDIHPNPGPNPVPMPASGVDERNDLDVQQRELGDLRKEVGRPKSQLQVVTLNVRGLGCSKKVRHLVNTCYKMSSQAADSIFMLQETYVEKLDLLRYLWRGEFHLTPGTGNSLGCITLVTAPFKVMRVIEVDQRGHVLVLTKNDINKADLIVMNLYAPNGLDAEKSAFFRDVFGILMETIDDYNCSNVIVGGDLNLVFHLDEVKNRMISPTERRIADMVRTLIQRSNLTDCWDVASERCYTWTSSRTGVQAFSTLDRILFSHTSMIFKEAISDWSMSVSDHAAVIVKFDRPEIETKSSFVTRLDPRLLQDQEGKEKLDEVFAELFSQRSMN